MQQDVNGVCLHVLEILHQEWNQVLLEQQLSWVVWLHEVILIVVQDSLLHVVFKTLWVFFHYLLQNIVNLLKVATQSSELSALLIVTMDVHQVGFQDVVNFTFEDNMSFDFVLEFLKRLVFGSLLTGFSSFLLPDFVGLFGVYFILFSLLNRLIFGLNATSMCILSVKNTIDNDLLGSFNGSLVFL